MKRMRGLGLVLVGIVLLPLVAYISYEVNTLNENEALITQIYDQLQDAALFSVNQYAWDVVTDWSNQVTKVLDEQEVAWWRQALEDEVLDLNSVLHGVVLMDTLAEQLQVVSFEGDAEALGTTLQARLQAEPDVITRILEQKRVGYQRLEPFAINEDYIALLYTPTVWKAEADIVGLLLEKRYFVSEIIATKLQETAVRGQYAMGLFRKGEETPVYATSSMQLKEASNQRSVWIFPDYVLGIKLQGESVEGILQARMQRNLTLVVALAVLLLLGVAFVYRNVSKEIELAQLKSDFVSNVSHELRTPLSLIRMFAETLEMGRVPTEEKRLEYYRIIGLETTRLTRLINNILNFSRMEAGKKTYHFQPLQVNDVVEDILHLYAYKLRSKGFEVEQNLGEDLPLIEGDTEAIAEALINLIDNAIKYSPEEKHVTLTTVREGEQVNVMVKDRGMGIAPEDQKKIFDKFYRVSSALVHDTKGTGLGLALIKHIMDAHKGSVRVASKIGKGSQFTLTFPIHA